MSSPSIHGRGTPDNPKNRFAALALVPDPDADPREEPAPATVFYRDAARSILSWNDSPDVPFDVSVNPYRGCEHGCAYCYARPTHEYAGFSAGLDFETKILVKEDAPELLRRELMDERWRPQTIAFSGVTDCYQPVERKLQLTRRCLEVMAEFRNPAGIVTKSALVERDVDVLQRLAAVDAVRVHLSVTTQDDSLAAALEPRAPTPARRLAAIRALAGAGVPVGVLVAPVIPGLNDHEIPAILRAAYAAGARTCGYVMLRLPHGVDELFAAWLSAKVPNQAQKILHRIESVRGGGHNDPRFGSRMRGEGIFADEVAELFRLGAARAGFAGEAKPLSTAAFRRPGRRQGRLFG